MKRTRSKVFQTVRATRSSSSPLAPLLTPNQLRKKRRRITTHTSTLQPLDSTFHQGRTSVSNIHPTDERTVPVQEDQGYNAEEEEGDEDDEERAIEAEEDEENVDETENRRGSFADNDSIFQELANNDLFQQIDGADGFPGAEPGLQDAEVASSQESQDEDEIPLPETTSVRINFRCGNPSPPPGTKLDLRGRKNWPPKSFECRIGDGYNLFHARINDFIDQIRAVKEYRGVKWWEDTQPYIKPTVSARQKDFSPIYPEDLQPQLKRALRSIMKYNQKHPEKTLPIVLDVYVYLKDTAGKQMQTVQRQSQKNIEEANQQINQARETGRFDIGPITQTVYSRHLASQVAPPSDQSIPPPPNTPLYNQARDLDERIADLQRQRARSQARRDVAKLRLFAPGDPEHWMSVEADVSDLRRVLGFDLVRIGETTRDPAPELPARPTEDVVDIQH